MTIEIGDNLKQALFSFTVGAVLVLTMFIASRKK